MKYKLTAVAIILIATLLLSGCIIQRIAETGRDIIAEKYGSSHVSYQEDKLKIHAEIPQGFPGKVPIYPDMDISSSSKHTTNAKDFYSVSFETSDKGEKVFGWYKKNMGKWEVLAESVNEIEGYEKQYTIMSQDDKFSLTVLVIEDSQSTTVILTVAEKSDIE